MRSQWIPVSASALVIGVMALLLGSVLNPTDSGDSVGQTLRVVADQGPRWVAVAVLYFCASIAMTLGLPTILSLFRRRARWLGMAGTGVLSLGVIGMSGYAMLMVFLHALVKANAINMENIDTATSDLGLSIFLYVWIGGFVGGVLLIALALWRAGETPRWVPVLMLVFIGLFPVSSHIGRLGSALQVFALAVAFTGIAMAATSPTTLDAPRPALR
jgi:hypothetical protein